MSFSLRQSSSSYRPVQFNINSGDDCITYEGGTNTKFRSEVCNNEKGFIMCQSTCDGNY